MAIVAYNSGCRTNTIHQNNNTNWSNKDYWSKETRIRKQRKLITEIINNNKTLVINNRNHNAVRAIPSNMNRPQQQQDTKTRQRNKRWMQQIKNIPKIYKPKQDKIEIYTKQSPRVAFIIFIIQLIKILWDHVIFVMRCDYILCVRVARHACRAYLFGWAFQRAPWLNLSYHFRRCCSKLLLIQLLIWDLR